MLSNFKAVGQTQAELHSLKVEKLDTCIRRTSFANSVKNANDGHTVATNGPVNDTSNDNDQLHTIICFVLYDY